MRAFISQSGAAALRADHPTNVFTSDTLVCPSFARASAPRSSNKSIIVQQPRRFFVGDSYTRAGLTSFKSERPSNRSSSFQIVNAVPSDPSRGRGDDGGKETPSSTPEQAERTPNTTRSPPPDLPSLLLNERIIYVGMPIVPAVTEILIAQMLYLQWESATKPCVMYINSTGTTNGAGEVVGAETEAFALVDTMAYIKPPVHTVCLGQAYGTAALLLAAGQKGFRGGLSNCGIMLSQPRTAAQGQATEIAIRAHEVIENRRMMLEILSEKTGQTVEKLKSDTGRPLYLDPQDAVSYGIIDRVLGSKSAKKRQFLTEPLRPDQRAPVAA